MLRQREGESPVKHVVGKLNDTRTVRVLCRQAPRGPWVDRFWLDLKLGVRMLRKSWGLTRVGGLAMALTIGLAASLFAIYHTLAGTALPLDEGDRIATLCARAS